MNFVKVSHSDDFWESSLGLLGLKCVVRRKTSCDPDLDFGGWMFYVADGNKDKILRRDADSKEEAMELADSWLARALKVLDKKWREGK